MKWSCERHEFEQIGVWVTGHDNSGLRYRKCKLCSAVLAEPCDGHNATPAEADYARGFSVGRDSLARELRSLIGVDRED